MWRYLILVCVLAGCNTPTATFWGVQAQRITVQGSRYKVYIQDDRAQAIRTNPEISTRQQADAKIRKAIAQVSGCNVIGSLTGDPVLAHARIACPGGPAPSARPTAPPPFLVCDIEGEPPLERAYCQPG